MNENSIDLIGMPTLAMLPARNFNFAVDNELHLFTIPSKGKYVDLDADFFTEEDGNFVVHEKGTFNVTVITKVLFALKQYPKLEENQLFCPTLFEMVDGEVNIYGQVITMLGSKDEKSL